MFYVHGLNGVQFQGPLEHLHRVEGLSRARAVRPISRHDEDIGLSATVAEHQEKAIQAYRQMIAPDLERGPLYHASQIMSRPVIFVTQGSSVAAAWQILRDHRIHQAPVLDENEELVGIVSERDLLTAIDIEDGEVIGARQRAVRDVMTTPVVSAAPITDIRRIAAVMLEKGVDGVPVVTEAGHVSGFISRSDILSAIIRDPPLSLWR